MTLTVSLLIVVLITTAWLVAYRQYRRLFHFQLMSHGMSFIHHVRRALGHLPQHRGMANAFLNGDQDFREKMTQMQSEIDHDIDAINDCMTRHPLTPVLLTRWDKIQNGWATLKNEVKTISPTDSFERHSVLISEILYIVSDTSDEMRVSEHPDDEKKRIARTTFELLPTIIETIGQARGIGTGAAAKGTLITAVRIKLEFLLGRLDDSLQSAHATIGDVLQKAGGIVV